MQHQLQVNGLLFNVLDEGIGDIVLLVHGFPDDHNVWRNQVSALVAAGYRVIAPDTRGCGMSEMAPRTRDYALYNLVSDLAGILDALGVSKVRLVGHDWGAVIGWHFCIAHPSRVSSYVALSVGHPAAYGGASLKQKLKGWYVLMFQLRGFAEWLITARNWSFFRKFTGEDVEIERWIPSLSRPGRLTAAINYYRANLGVLLRPNVTKLRLPVMGVISDGDRFLIKEQMLASREYVDSHFRFEFIEHAGHWLQIDVPEQVNALLLEFFKDPLK